MWSATSSISLKHGLALAPWDRGIDVAGGVLYERLECLHVSLEASQRLVPRVGLGGRFKRAPVIVGPLGLEVAGIGAEIEEIVKGEAHVLQLLPASAGHALKLDAAKLYGEIVERSACGRVGAAAAKQFKQLVSKSLIFNGHLGTPARVMHESGKREERNDMVCTHWPTDVIVG